jgi:hypothetical protein
MAGSENRNQAAGVDKPRSTKINQPGCKAEVDTAAPETRIA